MRLSEFITENLDLILVDWVAFARNQLPAAEGMAEVDLLDHGKLILVEIADNMRRPQEEQERQAKSEGNSKHASTARNLPSRSHARQRERQGFDVEQMVAEYRALRATVLRLWAASSNRGNGHDLEDVVRFNEAVDQAVSESLTAFVSEVTKTRDLFLGMLGHDLRGPLGTIANCAAVVLSTQPGEARPLAMIARSVAQMKSLLDDLVEYTRHRLGAHLIIDPAPLHLGQFVQDTLDEIAALGNNTVLELHVDGEMQGKWDARRLHQALSNLVFNALKYGMPAKPIRIALDGSRPEEVLIKVSNAGKPIPPDLMASIFEPLVRADTEEGSSATDAAGANLGLGLYVVKQIAIAHGGSVTVESDAAATCFEVRLPRIARPIVDRLS
ncbi:MAG: sensor histidine kinase [Rubrivivax sp.]|nr:MAG: sensor histidine kinase [Rubrivivax sp.]